MLNYINLTFSFYPSWCKLNKYETRESEIKLFLTFTRKLTKRIKLETFIKIIFSVFDWTLNGGAVSFTASLDVAKTLWMKRSITTGQKTAIASTTEGGRSAKRLPATTAPGALETLRSVTSPATSNQWTCQTLNCHVSTCG